MADTTPKVQKNLVMPPKFSTEVWKNVQSEAMLPRLSGAMPQTFGKTDIMVLKSTPKAEIVGESDAKSASEIEVVTKEVLPLKLHCGIRVSDEFLWGEKERKMVIYNEICKAIQDSLVDALDTIGFYGVNPATGKKATQVTECISDATTVVTSSGKADEDIDAAYKAVIANRYAPRSIAADTSFAADIELARDKTGHRLYENGINGYLGMNAAKGTLGNGLEAVVGDFSAFKWGVQEQIPLQIIPYGDPDNTGRDLAGHNEVFVRAEVVYGIGIMDLDAFALVKKADTTGTEASE